MSRRPGNPSPYDRNPNPPRHPDHKRNPTGGNNPWGGGGGPQKCFKCGETGHKKDKCPLGKSFGGHEVHGSTAVLPPISAETKEEIDRENNIARSFEAAIRTGVQNPLRPSYGTAGKEVEFQTNYFPVVLPRELILHRYNIIIDVKFDKEGKKLPEPKSKKLKQIIRILLINLESSKPKLRLATDFKSTLICSEEIPQEWWNPVIKYYHEDDIGPRDDPRTYKLHTEEILPRLRVSALMDFLASPHTVPPYAQRESMLQALNILLGYHAKSTRTTTMVGGNRAFPNTPDTEKLSLTEGLEAVRGYFLSVRLASSHTLVNVNVNVSHGAFYQAIELRELINQWMDNQNPKFANEIWVRLEAFLKDLKVRTNYLKDKNGNQITQVQSIKACASPRDGSGQKSRPFVEEFAAAPRKVWFHIDDQRDFPKLMDPLKRKGVIQDKYISVNEFFQRKHGIRSDSEGRYPVINFRSREDPKYVPTEACTVEPGDTLTYSARNSQLGKITPDLTEKMIRFAVRNPSQNASSINIPGLRALGLSPQGPRMMQFNVGIDPKMITVYGRMLSPPAVHYHGDIPASPAPGGWNLKGVKFKTRLPKESDETLKDWGCLRLHDSRLSKREISEYSWKYDQAISKLKGMLDNCGIKTREPWSESLSYDKRRDEFSPKTMQDTIKTAHRERKIGFFLIGLPSKDTTLYNSIKRYCDLFEGVHTICVVATGKGKFYECNSTYLANVALKFNLKLGGTNHVLRKADMGIVTQGKTMVVGIDVIHPSPGSDKASVASMVASIDKDLAQWPVDLRVQVRKGQEMLDKVDQMLRSRLLLWHSHWNAYPENILVYRDGVSESQYPQVLSKELEKMREESRKLYSQDKQPPPRFTLIIVGKRHHTRFFPLHENSACDKRGNPNRGLVVDRGITEARNWDFFLQSHNAIQGTARPAHYVVLWDEIFTNETVHQAIQPELQPTDRLERLTHSLCYLFSRAAKAVSIPAPVYYADIACERAGRYLATTTTEPESVKTDATKMTDGEREKYCQELQKKIAVRKELKDSMFYI